MYYSGIIIVGFLQLFIMTIIVGCASPTQSIRDRDAQMNAIDERLKDWQLSNLQMACDSCNFYMQESIKNQNAKVNQGDTKLSRSESGIKVYRLDDIDIEHAFITLLDSNIFAQRINRDHKIHLIEAIKAQRNDFSEKSNLERIDMNGFSSISYAKRLKNNPSLPRVMLDSVFMFQGENIIQNFTDSLEGFIVGNSIVILHFYSESQSWRR